MPVDDDTWVECDLTGCRGARMPSQRFCAAHSHDWREGLVRMLEEGDVDLRGTEIAAGLIDFLLSETEHDGHRPCLPRCRFDRAVFTTRASFGTRGADGVRFTGAVSFDSAIFRERADFRGAQFEAEATFRRTQFEAAANFLDGARFAHDVRFDDAHFDGTASFDATFAGASAWTRMQCMGRVALFDSKFMDGVGMRDAKFLAGLDASGASFQQHAVFSGAVFDAHCSFNGTRFASTTIFADARFEGTTTFDGAHFGKRLSMRGAVLGAATSLDGLRASAEVDLSGSAIHATGLGTIVAGDELSLSGVTAENRVELAVAAPRVIITNARFAAGGRLTVVGANVTLSGTAFPARTIVAGGVLSSLDGSDVEALTLSGVNCRECHFIGAQRLDALRIEGGGGFDRVRGRRVVAEEIEWRRTRRRPEPWDALAASWIAGPTMPRPPQVIAAVYRDLRKGREDNKDEPGAADFYYGEMEMRRHAAFGAERAVLTAYWLISGYGLRASRAVVAFLALIAVTAVMLAAWGFGTAAVSAPPFQATDPSGRVTRIEPDPPPSTQRDWAARLEDGVWLSLESAVFRSPRTDLTTAGQRTLLLPRMFGPILVALALLALRGRVKR